MSDAKIKRRSRLSLLNLMLLVTAAAMALVAFRQTTLLWQREADIGAMQGELIRMRAETQQLEVADPTRLCVRAIGEDAWGSRTWRIYVPADSSYRLFAKADGLPAEGLPTIPWPKPKAGGQAFPWHHQPGRFGMLLNAGEHSLACDSLQAARFHYQLNHIANSRWTLLAKRSGGTTGCPTSTGSLGRPSPARAPEGFALKTDAPAGEEVAVSPDKNLVLFDTRTPDQPGRGLLIWLEPVP